MLKGKFERPKLRKPCKKCGNYFIPTGIKERLCISCFRKARNRK